MNIIRLVGSLTNEHLTGSEQANFFLIRRKQNLSFFNKQRLFDGIPLRIPIPKYNNFEIKREIPIKFHGVIIDENLNWKNILISYILFQD